MSTSTTSTSTTTTSTTSTTSTSTTLQSPSIEDIRSRINFNLQDDSEILKPNEIELSLKRAVRVYSNDKPQEQVHENSDADGSTYDFDFPDGWVDKFSQIISRIEYPIRSDIQTPQYVDGNDWIIYKKASGNVLRFLTFKPASGYTFRYVYLLPHVVSESECTVPENDIEAVAALATAFCCSALSAKYAQTSEPSVDADVVNYSAKSADYRDLAELYYGQYKSHVKGGAGEEKAGAIAFADMDLTFSWKSDYLTHPSENR